MKSHLTLYENTKTRWPAATQSHTLYSNRAAYLRLKRRQSDSRFQLQALFSPAVKNSVKQ